MSIILAVLSIISAALGFVCALSSNSMGGFWFSIAYFVIAALSVLAAIVFTWRAYCGGEDSTRYAPMPSVRRAGASGPWGMVSPGMGAKK